MKVFETGHGFDSPGNPKIPGAIFCRRGGWFADRICVTLLRLVERATRPQERDPLTDASAPASQIFRFGYFAKNQAMRGARGTRWEVLRRKCVFGAASFWRGSSRGARRRPRPGAFDRFGAPGHTKRSRPRGARIAGRPPVIASAAKQSPKVWLSELPISRTEAALNPCCDEAWGDASETGCGSPGAVPRRTESVR